MKIIRYPIIAFIVLSLILLLTDWRLLLWEHRVESGQTYRVEGWGNLGKSSHPSIVCYYFTGRSITISVFWYSPNNILGRNSCPLIKH